MTHPAEGADLGMVYAYFRSVSIFESPRWHHLSGSSPTDGYR